MLLTCSHTIVADVIFDQIGPMDGSMVEGVFEPNQYFEPKFSDYDIAVLEYIPSDSTLFIANTEFVLGGWNGFVDPSSISAIQSNAYSSPESAAQNLTGDIASHISDFADVTVVEEWLGTGFLLSIPTELNIELTSSFWCSIIPLNPFATDGQTGIGHSLAGDGVTSMQANPGNGFGFGGLQQLDIESAMRLTTDTQPNQCDSPLPSTCSEDVNGDFIIDTTDLLAVIATWGECGDGTNRPLGDVAPLPNGDCCVNLADILAVIGSWGEDCNEYGGCCLTSGDCIEALTSSECVALGGIYGGKASTCASTTCIAGACCFDGIMCSDYTQKECSNKGGYYLGDGSICQSSDCESIFAGDECSDAIVVVDGLNAFDTTPMSPSKPLPDGEFCNETNFDWGESADVWFVFVASITQPHRFTLCNEFSYDTSLVLYEGSCSNQIACNGDAEFDGEDGPCQLYYSALEYELIAGESYYIRIGGWQGETGQGALTIYSLPDPVPGACCFSDGNCIDDLIADECTTFGGQFAGETTICSGSICNVAEGDECQNASVVFEGPSPFDTTNATPSDPQPDESMCADTFLNWEESPDIWLSWTAQNDGVATFDTCDTDSFDTSIVLYEGNCNAQIACNGDSQGQSGCQEYYSSITYAVSMGETYFIRIGGWQGTTGVGTMNIDLVTNKDTGACCVNGSCQGILTLKECNASAGIFYPDELCKQVNCELGNCSNSQFFQAPSPENGDWLASTSAIDSTNDIDYLLAEFVNVPVSNEIKVWGLQLRFDFDTSEWNQCDDDFMFNIRAHEDVNGFPGAVISESLNVVAKKVPTGTLYAGLYELYEWTIPFSATNIEHLSIQSASDGIDCWFLWMSSQEGDGFSSSNSGSGWEEIELDLSICIE